MLWDSPAVMNAKCTPPLSIARFKFNGSMIYFESVISGRPPEFLLPQNQICPCVSRRIVWLPPQATYVYCFCYALPGMKM